MKNDIYSPKKTGFLELDVILCEISDLDISSSYENFPFEV